MEPSPIEPSEEVVEPEISPDGVDIGLIRWMLSLTPTERLEVLQDWVDGLLALRNGRVGD
jgi:hypothetical protein